MKASMLLALLVSLVLVSLLVVTMWPLIHPAPSSFAGSSHQDEALSAPIAPSNIHAHLPHCALSLYETTVPLATCNVILAGAESYGGWHLCEPPRTPLIVYSYGIGEDTSFDEAMINRFKAQVFAFDPTPRAKKYVDSRLAMYKGSLTLRTFGLGRKDGVVTFYAPQNPDHVSLNQVPRQGAETITVMLQTLYSAMRLVGHCKIDVLKIDVEGEEFEVLMQILLNPAPLVFDQVLVEFHPGLVGAEGNALVKQISTLLEIRGFSISKATQSNEISFYRARQDRMVTVNRHV